VRHHEVERRPARAKQTIMNELEVRQTVELYRSMLNNEFDERRRIMLAELLDQEERKLRAIQMMNRSSQDN
jgi:hypothetical protein